MVGVTGHGCDAGRQDRQPAVVFIAALLLTVEIAAKAKELAELKLIAWLDRERQ